jgi:hypothetical protein
MASSCEEPQQFGKSKRIITARGPNIPIVCRPDTTGNELDLGFTSRLVAGWYGSRIGRKPAKGADLNRKVKFRVEGRLKTMPQNAEFTVYGRAVVRGHTQLYADSIEVEDGATMTLDKDRQASKRWQGAKSAINSVYHGADRHVVNPTDEFSKIMTEKLVLGSASDLSDQTCTWEDDDNKEYVYTCREADYNSLVHGELLGGMLALNAKSIEVERESVLEMQMPPLEPIFTDKVKVDGSFRVHTRAVVAGLTNSRVESIILGPTGKLWFDTTGYGCTADGGCPTNSPRVWSDSDVTSTGVFNVSNAKDHDRNGVADPVFDELLPAWHYSKISAGVIELQAGIYHTEYRTVDGRAVHDGTVRRSGAEMHGGFLSLRANSISVAGHTYFEYNAQRDTKTDLKKEAATLTLDIPHEAPLFTDTFKIGGTVKVFRRGNFYGDCEAGKALQTCSSLIKDKTQLQLETVRHADLHNRVDSFIVESSGLLVVDSWKNHDSSTSSWTGYPNLWGSVYSRNLRIHSAVYDMGQGASPRVLKGKMLAAYSTLIVDSMTVDGTLGIQSPYDNKFVLSDNSPSGPNFPVGRSMDVGFREIKHDRLAPICVDTLSVGIFGRMRVYRPTMIRGNNNGRVQDYASSITVKGRRASSDGKVSAEGGQIILDSDVSHDISNQNGAMKNAVWSKGSNGQDLPSSVSVDAITVEAGGSFDAGLLVTARERQGARPLVSEGWMHVLDSYPGANKSTCSFYHGILQSVPNGECVSFDNTNKAVREPEGTFRDSQARGVRGTVTVGGRLSFDPYIDNDVDAAKPTVSVFNFGAVVVQHTGLTGWSNAGGKIYIRRPVSITTPRIEIEYGGMLQIDSRNYGPLQRQGTDTQSGDNSANWRPTSDQLSQGVTSNAVESYLRVTGSASIHGTFHAGYTDLVCNSVRVQQDIVRTHGGAKIIRKGKITLEAYREVSRITSLEVKGTMCFFRQVNLVSVGYEVMDFLYIDIYGVLVFDSDRDHTRGTGMYDKETHSWHGASSVAVSSPEVYGHWYAGRLTIGDHRVDCPQCHACKPSVYSDGGMSRFSNLTAPDSCWYIKSGLIDGFDKLIVGDNTRRGALFQFDPLEVRHAMYLGELSVGGSIRVRRPVVIRGCSESQGCAKTDQRKDYDKVHGIKLLPSRIYNKQRQRGGQIYFDTLGRSKYQNPGDGHAAACPAEDDSKWTGYSLADSASNPSSYSFVLAEKIDIDGEFYGGLMTFTAKSLVIGRGDETGKFVFEMPKSDPANVNTADIYGTLRTFKQATWLGLGGETSTASDLNIRMAHFRVHSRSVIKDAGFVEFDCRGRSNNGMSSKDFPGGGHEGWVPQRVDRWTDYDKNSDTPAYSALITNLLQVNQRTVFRGGLLAMTARVITVGGVLSFQTPLHGSNYSHPNNANSGMAEVKLSLVAPISVETMTVSGHMLLWGPTVITGHLGSPRAESISVTKSGLLSLDHIQSPTSQAPIPSAISVVKLKIDASEYSDSHYVNLDSDRPRDNHFCDRDCTMDGVFEAKSLVIGRLMNLDGKGWSNKPGVGWFNRDVDITNDGGYKEINGEDGLFPYNRGCLRSEYNGCASKIETRYEVKNFCDPDQIHGCFNVAPYDNSAMKSHILSAGVFRDGACIAKCGSASSADGPCTKGTGGSQGDCEYGIDELNVQGTFNFRPFFSNVKTEFSIRSISVGDRGVMRSRTSISLPAVETMNIANNGFVIFDSDDQSSCNLRKDSQSKRSWKFPNARGGCHLATIRDNWNEGSSHLSVDTLTVAGEFDAGSIDLRSSSVKIETTGNMNLDADKNVARISSLTVAGNMKFWRHVNLVSRYNHRMSVFKITGDSSYKGHLWFDYDGAQRSTDVDTYTSVNYEAQWYGTSSLSVDNPEVGGIFDAGRLESATAVSGGFDHFLVSYWGEFYFDPKVTGDAFIADNLDVNGRMSARRPVTLTGRGDDRASYAEMERRGDSLTAPEEGSNRGGLRFDGTSDFVEIFKPLSDVPRTFMAWVKVSPGDSSRHMVIAGNRGQPDEHFPVNWEIESGRPSIAWPTGLDTQKTVVFDSNLATGNWEHVAFVRESGAIRCYHNGNEVSVHFGAASPAGVDNWYPDFPVRLGADMATEKVATQAANSPNTGASADFKTRLFKGDMDEVHMFATPLPQLQIRQMMMAATDWHAECSSGSAIRSEDFSSGCVSGTCTRPLALASFRFEDSSGTRLTDCSGRNVHGVVRGTKSNVGAARWVQGTWCISDDSCYDMATADYALEPALFGKRSRFPDDVIPTSAKQDYAQVTGGQTASWANFLDPTKNYHKAMAIDEKCERPCTGKYFPVFGQNTPQAAALAALKACEEAQGSSRYCALFYINNMRTRAKQGNFYMRDAVEHSEGWTWEHYDRGLTGCKRGFWDDKAKRCNPMAQYPSSDLRGRDVRALQHSDRTLYSFSDSYNGTCTSKAHFPETSVAADFSRLVTKISIGENGFLSLDHDAQMAGATQLGSTKLATTKPWNTATWSTVNAKKVEVKGMFLAGHLSMGSGWDELVVTGAPADKRRPLAGQGTFVFDPEGPLADQKKKAELCNFGGYSGNYAIRRCPSVGLWRHSARYIGSRLYLWKIWILLRLEF